ncbi:hypothetical protein WK07_04560 [Burkholderia multivorans]|uniref:hypothetical protein n=1 Tax=Burkholderia multivorans TaxID=87883 RepID=UPI00075782F4|nr:hypothetical protein [Burkholderia multivorans]KVQ85568.1 hypothetical protein WK07_04560 [Burkholderia multivorans]
MEPKQITIESDGTALGTKLFDADGKPMDMNSITRIEWSIDGAGAVAEARVTFAYPKVNVRGALKDG